jgi:hypothetical protein
LSVDDHVALRLQAGYFSVNSRLHTLGFAYCASASAHDLRRHDWLLLDGRDLFAQHHTQRGMLGDYFRCRLRRIERMSLEEQPLVPHGNLKRLSLGDDLFAQLDSSHFA